MPALDSLYRRRSGLWAPYYAIMEQQLGNTATLLDFGNIGSAGQPTATTWTGRKFHASGLSPVWTPSEALSAFDTAFDLKLESNWQGLAPVLTFNGTDEEADTPDAAYWTRATAAFSLGAWVNITDTATQRTIMAKYDTGVAIQEWFWAISSADKLQLLLRDDSVPAEASRLSDAVVSQGGLIHVAATYDGGGGATAANGIALYVNGAAVASTATNDANYVAMEDGTSVVTLGFNSAANFFNGKMLGGPWSPFFVQAQLTADQVANIYQNMRLGLGV